MKNFLFGLIVGLIVGFLGVLAYMSAVRDGEAEAQPAEIAQRPSAQRRRAKGVEVARVALRSRLFGRDPSPQQRFDAYLGALDQAAFDRDWATVSAAAEGLREVAPQLRSGAQAGTNPKTSSAEAAAASPFAAGLRLRQASFWRELRGRRNAATKLYELKDRDELVGQLNKLLTTPANSPRDEATRRDAAFILARQGGDQGLLLIAAQLQRSRSPEERARLTLALARCGQPRAETLLMRLAKDAAEVEIQLACIAALGEIESVAAGRSPAVTTLARLVAQAARERVRRAAAKTLGTVELAAAKDARPIIATVLAEPGTPAPVRIAIATALMEYSAKAKGLPVDLLRATEGVCSANRDGPLRELLLRLLGSAGDAKTLESVRELAATVSGERSREALTAAKNALELRYGQD